MEEGDEDEPPDHALEVDCGNCRVNRRSCGNLADFGREIQPTRTRCRLQFCDAAALRLDGNIFVRCPSAGVTRGSGPRPSLTKVGPDGKRAATFDLSAAAADGLGDLVLKVFAVDPGGAL